MGPEPGTASGEDEEEEEEEVKKFVSWNQAFMACTGADEVWASIEAWSAYLFCVRQLS